MIIKFDESHGASLDKMLDLAERLGYDESIHAGFIYEYHVIRERDMWSTLTWSGHQIEARFEDV
jgi:hypothetical protein